MACVVRSIYDTIMDSGATCHVIINNLDYASKDINVRKATGTNAVALGDNSIILPAIDYCDIGILLNVMIVPKMTINLISASCLDVLGYTIIIVGKQFHLLKENKLIMKGPLLNGLYQTKLSEFIPSINNSTYTVVQTTVR
jgi:hypothetical protein